MTTEISRRRYLLAVGSAVATAGCSAQRARRTNRRRDGNPAAMPGPVTVDYYVGDGGEFDDVTAAYRTAEPAEVIGLGPGQHSLGLVTRSVESGPLEAYALPGKAGITVVGSGKNRTVLSLQSEEDVLVLPAWRCREVTVDTAGAVVGPRANTFRACRIVDPIMDPPGFGSASAEVWPGTVVTTSGLPRTPTAARTYHGLAFDRVLDGVDDLGFDRTGTEPIDAVFDDAYESGTLIELPPGEYLVAGEHQGNRVSRFGLRGLGASRRDVQIKAASGAALKWLKAVESGPHLIENLSFHERSDDTSQLSLWLTTGDGSVLKNVEWLGRTPADDSISYTLTAEVTDRDGVFVIDGIYAGLDEPAVRVSYPNGVSFLRSGPTHLGEIFLRNPVIHERNSAATRSTAPEGVLTIEGGEFVNNQNANIRFGAGDHPSKVSSATGTYVKVDGSRKTADAVRLGADSSGYAGAVFKDLEIEWTKQSGRGVIALPNFGHHGRAEFYNCVIRNDGDNTMTINADAVDIADDDVIVENCAFTGTGKGFDAADRSGSVIRDSCIDMPNASITIFDTENVSTGGCRTPGGDTATDTNDGPTASISVVGTDGLTVDLSGADSSDPDGNIVSYAWTVGGTAYTGETVTHTFAEGGTYTVELTVEDDAGATATATRDVTVEQDTYENFLSIQGTGTTTEYAFEVSGALEGVNDSIEEWDDVSASSATGYVTDSNDADEFGYDGEITSFEFLEGEAAVYRNGTRIYPTRDLQTLRIEGTGTTTEYAFEVSDVLQPVSDTIEEWDDVSASSATGYVTDSNDADEFEFAGEITSFEFLEGRAEVYVDGERIYPTQRRLSIRGTGSVTEYDFAVSGELDPIADTIENWDDVSASSATGFVTNSKDVDEFDFTGEFTRFDFVRGEADVYVDGELIDVSNI